MEGSTTLETIKVARQFVTFFNYPLNLETDYEDIDGTHSEEEMVHDCSWPILCTFNSFTFFTT